MVAAVRRGESKRSVAGRFRVSLCTVQRWVSRAAGHPLTQVDWSDRPSGPIGSSSRTPRELEDLILELRRELREKSDLGEYGAAVIHAELVAQEVEAVPCERTIYRILERRGALDGKRRVRRTPPPPGWYLPPVAAGKAELDQFDIIEGLKIKAGPLVEVVSAISLHGGLVASWPTQGVKARLVRECLVQHWRQWGRPDYAQFDNDTVFQGPHQHRDVVGSVSRLCLGLGVVPVFAPPRETGFQAAIEAYNGRWQAKVWARFHHESLDALCDRSARYVAAHRRRTLPRRDGAPERTPLPRDWNLDLQSPPVGRIIYLRRTDDQGRAALLGRTFEVAPGWCHRLVRCEVLLSEHCIRFYALRRRAPHDQPLLNTVRYRLPIRKRAFQE